MVTCSGLKRVYREVPRAADPHTFFVHLALEPRDATARVAARDAHFMPSSLVTSQFEALEPLEDDEAGLTLDATLSPVEIVARVQTHLASGEGG